MIKYICSKGYLTHLDISCNVLEEDYDKGKIRVLMSFCSVCWDFSGYSYSFYKVDTCCF